MVYTCYEMIRDCGAGRAEGWSYFLAQYVPVIRGFLKHYFPEREGDGALIERVLVKLRHPESSLFQTLDPAPERAFVAELRQHVLQAVEGDHMATVASAALEPLTVTERLVVWFETMRYGDADTGRMLRMSPQTVQKIRGRAAELVRAATAGETACPTKSAQDCLPAKAFFDVIDGRATWRGREEMERHVKGCWHCIDHYGRLLEVVDALRAAKPLGETEVQRYKRLLRSGVN